jgi:hypothetical protein
MINGAAVLSFKSSMRTVALLGRVFVATARTVGKLASIPAMVECACGDPDCDAASDSQCDVHFSILLFEDIPIAGEHESSPGNQKGTSS